MVGKVDDPIPPHNVHSISINLPTWQSAVEYAHDINTHSNVAADTDVFKHGYPRSKLHPLVWKLCRVLQEKYAKEGESCLCFPSYNVAKRCREYIRFKSHSSVKIRILQLATAKPNSPEEKMWRKECKIAVVFVKQEYYPIMMGYWQLSGEIISSRAAEYVLHELFVLGAAGNAKKPADNSLNDKEFNFTFTSRARKLIKKRITNNFIDLNEESEAENYHFHETNSDPNMTVTYLDSETASSSAATNQGNHGTTNDHLSDWDLEFRDGEGFDERDANNADGLVNSHMVNSLIPPEPIDMGQDDDEAQGNIDILTPTHIRTQSMNSIQEEQPNSLVNPETDVFLFPSGMASLFTTLRLLLQFDLRRVNRTRNNGGASTGEATGNDTNGAPANLLEPSSSSPIPNSTRTNSNSSGDSNASSQNPYKKTVMFGLPYSDTLKMLRTFNNTYFLPSGENEAMVQLKRILHSGEQILAVFIETPSNPLLKMGNILELKELSDMFGFYIVLDESIGSFVNIDGLQHADIVCSSLTKLFGGETGTMAGSLILNPRSKLYSFAQEFLNELGEYEDNLWAKDVLVLERDSREYVSRTMKTNFSTDQLLDNVIVPQVGKVFKRVYHPRFTSKVTKDNYELVKCSKDSGYGNMFSVTFFSQEAATAFYDALELYKGPSLGSTLSTACPYTILHYGKDAKDLEEAVKFGLDPTLVRVSIGCESRKTLFAVFQHAIDHALALSSTPSVDK